MDKYKAAIRQYAYLQRQIKELTRRISEASITPIAVDEGGIFFDYLQSCERLVGKLSFQEFADESTQRKTCLERLWEYNKTPDDDFCDYDECPTLCPSCKKVQALVDERKEARRKFGIEKRRISLLGYGLI